MPNPSHPQPARINLQLRELAQLFNSMDPSPFIDRDLDRDAEEFVVSWARELPSAHGFELSIHLATAPDPGRVAEVQHSVRRYFAARAEMKAREFRRLLRQGHASLVIGLLFLGLCLWGSSLVPDAADGRGGGVLREGLIIAGWVAMWRPLQIYLYDWWPLRAEWRILQKLAHMHVRLVLPHERKPAPASG